MCLIRTCRDRLSDHNLRRRKRVAEAASVCAPMIDPAVLWQTTPANAAISRSGRAASRHLVTGEGCWVSQASGRPRLGTGRYSIRFLQCHASNGVLPLAP